MVQMDRKREAGMLGRQVDAPVMLSRNRRHFKKRPHRGARVGVRTRGGRSVAPTLSISSYFIDIGGGIPPPRPLTCPVHTDRRHFAAPYPPFHTLSSIP